MSHRSGPSCDDRDIILKVLGKVLDNPDNTTFQRISKSKIKSKLKGKEKSINNLLQAGFYESDDGRRLIFDPTKVHQLRQQYLYLSNQSSRSRSVTEYDQKYEEDDEISNDETKHNTDTTPSQLRQYAPRPTSCNGDCGALFSKMISQIINPEVKMCYDLCGPIMIT